EQQSSDPVSLNVSANKDRINNVDDPVVSGVSRICHETERPRSSISQERGNPNSGEISVENDMDADTSVHSSSIPVSQASNTPPTSQVPEEERRHETTIPSGLGILVSNREIVQGNDG
ncbi:RING finger protein, partial [Trifolium medium]|nr:RING finger protein [Trifolium medium]